MKGGSVGGFGVVGGVIFCEPLVLEGGSRKVEGRLHECGLGETQA